MKPIVLLLSGGLDSVTLAYELSAQNRTLHAVLFDYGQIHRKELVCARNHCDILKLPKTVVELQRVHNLFQRSALTDGKGGPVVPNRNSVLTQIAASIAAGMDADVAIGINADDAAEFPDCRQGWLDATNATLKASGVAVKVIAPYIGLTKRQIVNHAKALGVSFQSVWWCYSDSDKPCKKCPACKKMKGLYVDRN